MFDSTRSDDRPLRVQRVRRYRVPRYPSHVDPDPTTTPEPVPYPWKSSMVAAMLALGEVSCGKSKPPVPTIAKRPARVLTETEQKAIDAVVATALRETPKGAENPFAMKLGLSGLPHVSSSYGTGEPTPLDADLAQRLISELFKAEGLKPEPTTFAEKDFAFSADGYDKDKRVGYVIGDWNNLGEGAYSNWLVKDIEEIATGRRLPQSEGDENRLNEHIDAVATRLIERRNDQQTAQLTAIRKVEPLQARAKAYVALLSKLDEPKLSMAEIERAEKMAEARQRHLAIISVFDKRFETDGVTPELRERFREIEREAEKQTFADSCSKRDWIVKQYQPLMAEVNRQRLANLAQAVREYIAWARRSGVQ